MPDFPVPQPDFTPAPGMVAARGSAGDTGAAPPPANQVIPHELLQAYSRATHAGDRAAMEDLHGRILEASQMHSNPMEGMAPGTASLAGAAHGVIRPLQGAANLAHLPIPGTSDEDLKAKDELNKPLLADSEGKMGDLAGQVGVTLPLGAASGPLRAALAALKGGGGTAARVLTRALLAGGEGATQSATTAEIGKQGDEGATGGALSAGLSLAGGVGGKLARGLVGKSETADRLYQDAAEEGKDLFIPVSQGGTGPIKEFYQKALPYALGVEKRLKGQSTEAKQVMEEVAAHHAMPVEKTVAGTLEKVQPPIGNTMEQTAEDIGKTYDRSYQNTVKSYAFKAPEDFRERVLQRLEDHPELGGPEREQIASTMDEALHGKVGKDGTLNGAQLTDLLAKSRMKLEGLERNGIGNPAATNSAVGSFKDIVQDAIDEHKSMLPGLKGKDAEAAAGTIRDLENYQRLGKSWGGARALMDTVESNIADRGSIKFGKLANEAPPQSPMRSLAQDTHEVLEKESPGAVNPAGRHFLHSLALGGSLFGHTGAPLAVAAGAIGAGNLMATRPFQKGLYGDLGGQQALADFLRKHSQAAYSIGQAGRETVNAERQ